VVKGINKDWRTKTHTFHDPSWDEDEVVTLKGYWGDRDRQGVLSAAVEQVRDEGGTVVTRATLDRFKTKRRQLAVVSWTLTYEDGQAMPYDEETVAQLPPAVADAIDAEIERLWEGLSLTQTPEQAQQAKEERTTFHGAGDAPARGAAAGRGSHERARAGDPGTNAAAAASTPSLEGVRRGLVGAE
jgi:hypothetical protein